MNINSLLAISSFSILTTLTWILRKTVLKKREVVSFVFLETFFVCAAILISSYFILGHKKFIEIPTELTVNEIGYMSLLGVLIAGSIYSMRYLIKYEDISKLSPMIGGLKTILVAIVGILLFREEVTMRKLISISLIISGLFLFLSN
jgi:drug/metabolite transporter (DMT)-like permease